MRLKRVFDLSIVLISLILLSPLLLAIATIVRFKLGSPVFFHQQRPGMNGKPFIILKFRTMEDLRDQKGQLLSDTERTTYFGRFLRSTSLDELPELFNILKGDMSFVGPRPLLMKYLPLYTPEQARRHEVKPGITGWAQVNGRNTINWEKKFRYDIWYVDNCSMWLDITILFLTILKVIKREGVSQEGHISMDEFMGSEPLHTDSFNNIDKHPKN